MLRFPGERTYSQLHPSGLYPRRASNNCSVGAEGRLERSSYGEVSLRDGLIVYLTRLLAHSNVPPPSPTVMPSQAILHTSSSGLFSCPYSPECVEGGVLRSWPRKMRQTTVAGIMLIGGKDD